MDEDDRDFPPEAWEARIAAAYRRMKEGQRPVSWLPRVLNLKGLRRQVRRARAGVIEPGNPEIPTPAWADTLEQGIQLYELELNEERRQIQEERERAADLQRRVLQYNRSWMEIYQALKRLPAAADPNSEIGAQVLAMKRELRKLRGRPRRGRRRRG
jgi:predicted RNase H-like nuclease (RuvC/YqgF family)